MTGTVVAKVRSFLIRGLAVVAVILAYALGSVTTHVLSVVGVSSLVLATTATPAAAQRRWRRRRWRRRAPVRRPVRRRRR
jgi:hypothetical protein